MADKSGALFDDPPDDDPPPDDPLGAALIDAMESEGPRTAYSDGVVYTILSRSRKCLSGQR